MDIRVDEIAADVFRISYYAPEPNFTFNQYLVRDEEPLLYHTGFRKTFSETNEAIARLIDPKALRWIAYSHFEPDECGALNEWLAAAPHSSAIAGPVGGGVVLEDYADRPATILQDNETLSTGRKRFRLLCTPHLPHGWDASLIFEETEGTLFCSDLFLHGGPQAPVVESDIVEPARDQLVHAAVGPFAHSLPYTTRTAATFQRLAQLNPRTFAVMHGAAFRGDGARALMDLKRVAIFRIQGIPESGLAVIPYPRKGGRWANHIHLHCVAVSLRLSRTGTVTERRPGTFACRRAS